MSEDRVFRCAVFLERDDEAEQPRATAKPRPASNHSDRVTNTQPYASRTIVQSRSVKGNDVPAALLRKCSCYLIDPSGTVASGAVGKAVFVVVLCGLTPVAVTVPVEASSAAPFKVTLPGPDVIIHLTVSLCP